MGIRFYFVLYLVSDINYRNLTIQSSKYSQYEIIRYVTWPINFKVQYQFVGIGLTNRTYVDA